MRQVFQMDRNLIRGGAIMRKIISVIVIAFVLLILIACGKSEMVKAAETAIADIGQVTIESEDAIKTAESIFNGLTDHEKEQVNNRIDLIEARNQYEMLIEEQRLQLEEQQRQEELRAAEEQKKIDDGIQEAVDEFYVNMNVDKVISALTELYIVGNAQQKTIIQDWKQKIEGYCYKGTHFLTMEYVLSNSQSIEYDNDSNITYKKDNKIYRGALYRNDDYRKSPFYGVTQDGHFGDYHCYYFGKSFSLTLNPGFDIYCTEYLNTCFSSQNESVDWGDLKNGQPTEGKPVVYTDSLGNKLYYNAGDSSDYGASLTLHIKVK